MQVTETLKRGHWSAEVKESLGKVLKLEILTAADAIIGKWRLTVHMSRTTEKNEDKQILRYKHKQPFYLLFNPWCKEDQVFMEGDAEKDEYILNESGKIYTGTYKQIGAKPWNFGQVGLPWLWSSLSLLIVSKN